MQDGAKHHRSYLGLVPPFDKNMYALICGTGSEILNTNHMFQNPVVPFKSPHLSMFEELELFSPCAFDVSFSEVGCFNVLVMDVNSEKLFRCIAGIKLASGENPQALQRALFQSQCP